ncbi:MAG: hypothetical protein JWO27_2488 [Frankiales bacterium]|nr:hypothetical protein [Frankiales bacterium]
MIRLFAVALLAVLAAVGVAVSALGGVALSAYLLIVVTALGLAVRRQRPQQAGRTCSCCTSTVFDPVELL